VQNWGPSWQTYNWLKLVRRGNTFTASYSSNGQSGSWTELTNVTVNMSQLVNIGLAVSAEHDTSFPRSPPPRSTASA
jgi:hypothetical protein